MQTSYSTLNVLAPAFWTPKIYLAALLHKLKWHKEIWLTRVSSFSCVDQSFDSVLDVHGYMGVWVQCGRAPLSKSLPRSSRTRQRWRDHSSPTRSHNLQVDTFFGIHSSLYIFYDYSSCCSSSSSSCTRSRLRTRSTRGTYSCSESKS